MLFQSNQKILFVGDSITDAGRTWGQGELGQGYVKLIHDLLLARYPELHLQIVNAGVSGDTVRNLAERWERDVTAQKPDWVSLKIGVNDVWRAFDGSPQHAVPAEEYQQALRHFVEQIQAIGARPLLITPFLVEPNHSEPMRQQVVRYAELMRQVGQEKGVPVVSLQPAFDRASAATETADWAEDRVHPSDAGHALIALEFLRTIGANL